MYNFLSHKVLRFSLALDSYKCLQGHLNIHLLHVFFRVYLSLFDTFIAGCYYYALKLKKHEGKGTYYKIFPIDLSLLKNALSHIYKKILKCKTFRKLHKISVGYLAC